MIVKVGVQLYFIPKGEFTNEGEVRELVERYAKIDYLGVQQEFVVENVETEEWK